MSRGSGASRSVWDERDDRAGKPDARVFCEFDSYKWHGSRTRYLSTTRRRLELERHEWYGVPVTDDELDAGAPLAIAVLRERLDGAS